MSVNDSTGSKVFQTFVKPLVVAGVGGLAFNMMMPGSVMQTRILGDIPNYMAGAIGVGAGSLAADLLHQYILPELPIDNKLGYSASMLLAPLLAGFGAEAAFYILNPNSISAAGGSFFLIAAGSEIAGMYAFESILAPYLDRTDV